MTGGGGRAVFVFAGKRDSPLASAPSEILEVAAGIFHPCDGWSARRSLRAVRLLIQSALAPDVYSCKLSPYPEKSSGDGTPFGDSV